MGVLKRFEQRLEGLVNGTFAKVFKSEVQPVEIAGALQRECDNNATIWNRDRTVVPNDFIVELSTPGLRAPQPLLRPARRRARRHGARLRQAAALHLHGHRSRSTWRRRTTSTPVCTGSAAARSPPVRQPAGHPAARGPPRPRPRRAPAAGAGGYGYPPAAAPPPMPAAPPPGGRPGAAPAGPRPAARPAACRGPRRGAGSRSTAPATRSPARRWCWAAAPRPTCGSTTPASRAGTVRSGPERPRRSRISGPPTASWWTGQHTTRATLRDGSRIVVGSTTIIYRQAEG